MELDTAIQPSLASYRIVSRLGRGAMGDVYRAVQGTLERPVALKILPAELARNPELVARFIREARAAAALRHPNIVQVYDAGEEKGQFFIALELVEGSHLLKHCDDHKPFPEAEGLALLAQAAQGLAVAHAKGLIHRDIKPENMLLGHDGILRIADFGLVRETSSTTQLTATGACLGTPMYMSPEQADGMEADARTDLYCLGASFYRVLTGKPPFESTTALNMLFKHKFEPPVPPEKVRPELSKNTSNLLLSLMAKRPADRPQNAQAVLDLIAKIKDGKDIPEPVQPVSSNGSENTLIAAPGKLNAATNSGKRLLTRRQAMIFAGIVLILFAAGSAWNASRSGDKFGTVTGGDQPKSDTEKPSGSNNAALTNPAKPSNDDPQNSEIVFAQMQGVLEAALTQLKTGRDIDDSPKSNEYVERFINLRKQLANAPREIESVRSNLANLRTAIISAAEFYAAMAESADDKRVKVPFINGGSASEKAQRFKQIQKELKRLGAKTKTLLDTEKEAPAK